ncbi:MAG: radical SAM protein [Patescibacteria group bacterium]
MERLNLEKFEKANLVIEKDRVLSYSKLICPLDCKYCFSEDLNNTQSSNSAYLSEEQFELLKDLPEEIKTIMLGCDTEFFQNKNEALDVLRKLSDSGKDISIITKLVLDDEFVKNLKDVSNEMNKKNNFITFSVSIPCFESSNKWEPKVPKVEKRIDTLKRVSDAGINSMVAIRPLIPNLEESEIDKIIDLTNPYVFGYYSGPLYIKSFNNGLLSENELTELGCVFDEIEPNWMLKGNKFIKIENPKLMEHLHNKVMSYNKEFFDGAAQGIEFLRKNKNA